MHLNYNTGKVCVDGRSCIFISGFKQDFDHCSELGEKGPY